MDDVAPVETPVIEVPAVDAPTETEEPVKKARVVRRGFGKTRGRAAANAPSKRGFKIIKCKTDGCENEERVDANTAAVTCSTCVQKTAAPPPRPLTKEEREAKAEERKKNFFEKNAKPKKNADAWPDRAKTWPKAWWLKKEFVDPETGDVYRKGKKVEQDAVAVTEVTDAAKE